MDGFTFQGCAKSVCSVAALSTAPAAGRNAVPRVRTLSAHAIPHNAAARGLEVSLRHIAQNLLLQGKFSNPPLQLTVLFLQLLEPLRLVQL